MNINPEPSFWQASLMGLALIVVFIGIWKECHKKPVKSPKDVLPPDPYYVEYSIFRERIFKCNTTLTLTGMQAMVDDYFNRYYGIVELTKIKTCYHNLCFYIEQKRREITNQKCFQA